MISDGMFKAKKSLKAVNGISLNIQRGEVLGLVGESGCGKSTLAKILLGLIHPTEGQVLINGEPISSFNQLKMARIVQPIFQDPYSSLNPRQTIGSIIELPLRMQTKMNRKVREKKVAEIMNLVGLPQRVLNTYPSQMSGGQRQRVAIARALIGEPELVICDEPTSALDVSVQSQILNLLTDLQKELNLTYVIISHNLAVVEHIATRVAVMYLGHLVEVASTDELFTKCDHPYTQALLDSVLTPDPSLGIPDNQLGATFPNPLDPPKGCPFHPRCQKMLDLCSEIIPQKLETSTGFVECHLNET